MTYILSQSLIPRNGSDRGDMVLRNLQMLLVATIDQKPIKSSTCHGRFKATGRDASLKVDGAKKGTALDVIIERT